LDTKVSHSPLAIMPAKKAMGMGKPPTRSSTELHVELPSQPLVNANNSSSTNPDDFNFFLDGKKEYLRGVCTWKLEV
jgi:hypothetical protein